MKRIPNDMLIGAKSGRLTIKAVVGVSASRKRLVECLCDCGNTKTINISQFNTGAIRSCGCLLKETSAAHMKTIRHLGQNNRLRHGQTYEPEYYVWRTMKARCLNPKARMYHRYGGRGIKICERWMLFDNFFADMGKRPSPKHQLDRENNDGNYEKNNCRWITSKEQGNNRSDNVRISLNGETLTLSEWADKFHIDYHELWGYMCRKYTTERLDRAIRHLS